MGFDKEEMAKRLEAKRIAGYKKSKKMSENQKLTGALMGTGPVGALMYVAGEGQAKRCPKCKGKIEKGAKFCPECGLEL